jgi:hypothetical protein
MNVDNVNSTTVYSPTHEPLRFKKTTDVQQTWKEHGWISPSDDLSIQAKWHYYKTLGLRMENQNG